jgi:hypothetical protein
MTLGKLNIGDTFRVMGGKQQWFKVSRTEAAKVGKNGQPGNSRCKLSDFRGKEIELVQEAAEICRLGNLLVLRGGEVTLEYRYPLLVHRCTPGDPLTEIVFAGQSFPASRVKHPTPQTALMFVVRSGTKHLNRGTGSELFAYDGRVYIRATFEEVTGKAKPYGYQRGLVIDGARRVVIMGLLSLPSEFALYDIMMEHFGPDTVPQA